MGSAQHALPAGLQHATCPMPTSATPYTHTDWTPLGSTYPHHMAAWQTLILSFSFDLGIHYPMPPCQVSSANRLPTFPHATARHALSHAFPPRQDISGGGRKERLKWQTEWPSLFSPLVSPSVTTVSMTRRGGGEAGMGALPSPACGVPFQMALWLACHALPVPPSPPTTICLPAFPGSPPCMPTSPHMTFTGDSRSFFSCHLLHAVCILSTPTTQISPPPATPCLCLPAYPLPPTSPFAVCPGHLPFLPPPPLWRFPHALPCLLLPFSHLPQQHKTWHWFLHWVIRGMWRFIHGACLPGWFHCTPPIPMRLMTLQTPASTWLRRTLHGTRHNILLHLQPPSSY